ncbi:MAG: TonB family protein [Bryobacteraceae bacterium]
MFEQTFVDATQKTRKPYTVISSLLIQISAISVMILIPLVYVETLPSAQLKSMLVAPSPPAPVRTPPAVKVQPRAVLRQFNSHRLVAPSVMPNRINAIQETIAAPDMGVVGTNVDPGAANSVIGSLLSARQANPPAPPAPTKPKPASGPVRLGSVLVEANLIRKVQPVYPPLAKSARVQGSVEFTATIGKEGNIENLKVIHGHPLLVNAAKDAVLQWKYRPTLLNGQPVEVITEIIVNFTLTQ